MTRGERLVVACMVLTAVVIGGIALSASFLGHGSRYTIDGRMR
jgi:hypothetical protein